MAKRAISVRLLWVRVVKLDEASREGAWGLALYCPAGGWCLARGSRARMLGLQRRLLAACGEVDGDWHAGVEEIAVAAARFLQADRRSGSS